MNCHTGSPGTAPVSTRQVSQNGYATTNGGTQAVSATSVTSVVPAPAPPLTCEAPAPPSAHATWTGSSTLTYTQSAPPADPPRQSHHHTYCMNDFVVFFFLNVYVANFSHMI